MRIRSSGSFLSLLLSFIVLYTYSLPCCSRVVLLHYYGMSYWHLHRCRHVLTLTVSDLYSDDDDGYREVNAVWKSMKKNEWMDLWSFLLKLSLSLSLSSFLSSFFLNSIIDFTKPVSRCIHTCMPNGCQLGRYVWYAG